jgi:cation diffusion facilitator family transporter
VPKVPAQFRTPQVNRSRYLRVVRVTWIGIAVTLALTVMKVLAGWLTGSTALLADGVESLADSAVALAVVIGVRIAATPADADHPYGHGKAEALSATLIAWAMVLVVIAMGGRVIWQLFHPGRLEPPHASALIFLAGACVVSELLARYKKRQSRLLWSDALAAEARDHRKDVFSSAIAMVAVATAVLAGGRWTILDPLAGLITCGFVAWMAIEIIRETTPHLMDRAISGELIRQVRQFAAQVEGVQETEKLIARRSGLDVIVELHVEVDPEMTVTVAHDVATDVRNRVIERIDSVVDVLVHVEPHYPGDHVNPPEHVESTTQ